MLQGQDLLSSNSSNSSNSSCNTGNITIIGSGNYSIAIRPVITNVTHEYLEYIDQCTTDVTKIFKLGNDEDFEKELDILFKLKQIQDYASFTVSIKGASKFKVSTLPYDHDIMTNLNILYSNKENYDKYLYQIIFGYGGIPLNKLNNQITFIQFISIMRNFCIGMQKLQENNIVHRDIKPTNVLFYNNKLNLIDFGLACNINDVYANTDDNKYVLAYMYMYHPPEFYIAYLLYETKHKNEDSDFQSILDKAFEKMMSYTQELNTYYDEHYYKYHKMEPYDIFSYRKGFAEFYHDIVSKNVQTIEEIFISELAFKADIFGISYILKELKKHIVFDNIFQKQIYYNLYDMMHCLNPYRRASISEIITYIESVYV